MASDPESASDETAAAAGLAAARGTLHQAFRDVWRSLPDLLVYDVVFGVIAFAVLSPLVAGLFHKFVATSGGSAVGNFDIARFLLTPFGVAMTLIIIALLAAISFGRFAGLMYIGYGAAEDRRLTYADALRYVAGRARRILAASFFVLLVLVIAALPFVVAALLAVRTLLTEHDINYYLDVRPPEYWTAIAIGAGLAAAAAVVLVLVSVPLIFVLPQATFTDTPVWSAFRESRRLTQGQFRRIAIVMLLWFFAWTATSLVANGAIHLLGRLMVAAAGESVSLLLAVLGGITAVNIVANFAVGLAGVAVGCLLVVHLYRSAHRRSGIALPPLGLEAPPLGDKPEWSIPSKAPLALAVIVLSLAVFVAHQVLENIGLDDRVEITAHRGASLVAPENTLSAVRRAIADGATFVEFDVQLTADGALVVCHDADLMRVARVPMVITESNFDDLRAVDVGSSFAADFSGEQMPTLAEVIEATRDQVKLIVELKSYAADSARLAADVVRMLRDHDLTTDAVVMSLKYAEVQEVERLAPEIETGFVASAALGDLSQLDADFLAVSMAQATDALVGTAHAQGKQIYVWTIDDPDDMFALIDRGVDNIITNDPATLSRVLRERASLGNAERILLRFKGLYVQ